MQVRSVSSRIGASVLGVEYRCVGRMWLAGTAWTVETPMTRADDEVVMRVGGFRRWSLRNREVGVIDGFCVDCLFRSVWMGERHG